MKKRRFSVEQIVGVLNQAQVGVPVASIADIRSFPVVWHLMFHAR
jgi:hypothetical protein